MLQFLQNICVYPLAQFFADGNFVELTDAQYQFFQRWAALKPEQKALIDELIDQFK